MSHPFQIRPASLADAAAVARLAAEWGYPSTVEAMHGRLERLIASKTHRVLVAEIDGAVAGWVTGEIRSSLGSEPRAEITGLIVTTSQAVGRRTSA